MSRKPKYLSESQFKGKERGNSRGVSPGRRGPDEIEFDMDDSSLALCREAFDILDSNHSGSIGKEELEAVFSTLDPNDMVCKMLKGLGDLGDEVNFDQFCAHINNKKGNQRNQAGIQKIFELIDDGTGKITLESLTKICEEYGEAMTAEQLKESIRQVSAGKDFITPAEFLKLMRKVS